MAAAEIFRVCSGAGSTRRDKFIIVISDLPVLFHSFDTKVLILDIVGAVAAVSCKGSRVILSTPSVFFHLTLQFVGGNLVVKHEEYAACLLRIRNCELVF
jgi:hypothetical protein